MSDFTYVATWQGFVYVAFRHRRVCAMHRRLAGSCSARADFVLDALEQALYERRPCGKAASSTIAIVVIGQLFLGGLTLTAIDRLGWLVLQGVSVRPDPHPIDRHPCLSPDLSAAREQLAARFALPMHVT